MNEELQDELDQIKNQPSSYNFPLLQDVNSSGNTELSAIFSKSSVTNPRELTPAAQALSSSNLGSQISRNTTTSRQGSLLGSHQSQNTFHQAVYGELQRINCIASSNQNLNVMAAKIGQSSAVLVGSLTLSNSMQGVASVPLDQHRLSSQSDDLFASSSNEYMNPPVGIGSAATQIRQSFNQNNAAVAIQNSTRNIAQQKSALDEDDDEEAFEEEEVIPEIIEAEESGNDDMSSINQMQPLLDHRVSSQEHNKHQYLLINDNESEDLEASPQKLIQQQPKDDVAFFNIDYQQQVKLPKEIFLKSSRSTVLAEGEHHITMSTTNINFDVTHFRHQQSQPLPFQSMDDQMIMVQNRSIIKTIDWANQSVQEKKTLSHEQLSAGNDNNFNQHEFHHEVDEMLAELEEEEKLESHQPIVTRRSEVYQPLTNMLEEEIKSLNQQEDDEAQVLLRGRTSVLEEVEDDDIVNQNSSRSTSKSHSKDRDCIKNRQVKQQQYKKQQQSEQHWHENLQLAQQRHQFSQQEESKSTLLIYDQSVQQVQPQFQQIVPSIRSLSRVESVVSSNSSKRRSGRTNVNTRFTYFAASSLSDDRWLCPICLDIYEDAVETPCCHNLFCEGCIKKTPTCPLCNLRINGQLKPNIPIRRLVLELSVGCLNDMCEDTIRKGEMEKHIKICPFTLLICPNNEICGTIIRKNLDQHKNKECPYRIVECLLQCGLMLPLNDMEDHIQHDCPKFNIQCKNKCGQSIERGEMERHINIDCPLEIIDCPNKGESLFEEGCQIRLKRKEMESHKLSCNFRRVYCPNQKCNAIIIYKDLPSHDERCLFKIIDCENKCGQKVQRQNWDKHKEICEFQLIKCPYYDLGCKIEILRKDYFSHLQDEAFKHSIIFIEGQKKKNREIDELKYDLVNLRQNYDVEIQAMFLELNRVKEDMVLVKNKTGLNNHSSNHNNDQSSTKIILGANNGLGGVMNIKKENERRYEVPNSSAGSSMFEMPTMQKNNFYRRLEQQKILMSGQPNQSSNSGVLQPPNAFRPNPVLMNSNHQPGRPNIDNDSNSGSIAVMMHSFCNSSNNNPLVHNNLISSQQYTTSNNRQVNNNSIFSNNPFLNVMPREPQPEVKQENPYRPVLSFRMNNNINMNHSQSLDQSDNGAVRNNHTFNFNSNSNNNNNNSQSLGLFGENSQRGRISMLNSQRPNQPTTLEEAKSANEHERKQQIALFFGSINSSQESSRNPLVGNQPATTSNIQQQLQQSYQMCNSIEMRDFWREVKFMQENEQNKQREQKNLIDGGQNAVARRGTAVIASNIQRRGNGMNAVVNPNQDLDSSNVLYDDDFEIEEEKHNY